MVKLDDLREQRMNPDKRQFVTPGNKLYMVGAQDGSFQAFGHHIPNEMGGIWMHPIKLLDGFWLGFKEEQIEWLSEATTFVNYPYYNEHIYEKQNLTIIRRQFAPDAIPGLIVKYEIKNKTNLPQELVINWLTRTDLSPVWFADAKGITPNEDLIHIKHNQVFVKDSGHDWYVGIQVDVPHPAITCGFELQATDLVYGAGSGINWEFPFQIAPGETKTLVIRIAGSLVSENAVAETLAELGDTEGLFRRKKKYYEQIIETSNLHIPDKNLEKIYAWAKCHLAWLTLNNSFMAGLPEYAWWFGTDSAYTVLGALPAGFHESSKSTLDLIGEISRNYNKNGRIIHEANTFGVVGNAGNTQETAQFIVAVYEVFRWTGDQSWLESHYSAIKEGIKWLMIEMDPDQDCFPDGYGIIEILGLNAELIDTATYACLALKAAAKTARLFNDHLDAKRYRQLSDELQHKIRTEFWMAEQGLFGDFRISGDKLHRTIDNFITQEKSKTESSRIRYYKEVQQLLVQTGMDQEIRERTWNFKNWIINTPFATRIATVKQAEEALPQLNSDTYIGEYGMYLSGLGASVEKSIMTISTGVQIQANMQYGKTAEAFQLVKKMAATFNQYLPGSITEMSPDYGCFVQAWTAYGMLKPFISGFAGIHPEAYLKSIYLNPQLPAEWDKLVLEKVKIGSNSLDFDIERDAKGYTVTIKSLEREWKYRGPDTVTIKMREE
ncbi:MULTISPECIES: alpha-L-rhamnosidase-related protein [unclassified Jeotgalibaca]|uniref:alpha-L-rhamnosidase-related protein n=1 Tax=unclassified Jeotgalibaca TaxID=2621505 RepID=UPI003FD5DD24